MARKNKDYANYISARSRARSFIKNKATLEDIEEFKKLIEEREKFLKSEDTLAKRKSLFLQSILPGESSKNISANFWHISELIFLRIRFLLSFYRGNVEPKNRILPVIRLWNGKKQKNVPQKSDP